MRSGKQDVGLSTEMEKEGNGMALWWNGPRLWAASDMHSLSKEFREPGQDFVLDGRRQNWGRKENT